ncbi:hypothetical protein NIES2130_04405 [Scytonema sp. HK-05]|nr:hypothetical protein NIES2130_04405 [Scytonema sp. HK-05]
MIIITEDYPAALTNYLKRGFKPFLRETYVVTTRAQPNTAATQGNDALAVCEIENHTLTESRRAEAPEFYSWGGSP